MGIQKINTPKRVFEMFDYDEAIKMNFDHNCLFVLRELLVWFSNSSHSPTFENSIATLGLRFYWLSLVKKAPDWFYTPRYLRAIIAKFEKAGLAETGVTNRAKKQGSGKRFRLAFYPEALRRIISLGKLNAELKDNINLFIEKLDDLSPEIENIKKKKKVIKESKIAQVELKSIKQIQDTGIELSDTANSALVTKCEKEIRNKMNRSKEKIGHKLIKTVAVKKERPIKIIIDEDDLNYLKVNDPDEYEYRMRMRGEVL